MPICNHGQPTATCDDCANPPDFVILTDGEMAAMPKLYGQQTVDDLTAERDEWRRAADQLAAAIDDLAEKSSTTDDFDVCTQEWDGDPLEESPPECFCPACEAGVAWRHAYVAVLDRTNPALDAHRALVGRDRTAPTDQQEHT